MTYNKLLKLDAKDKIKNKNVTVTNYHGFAYGILMRSGIQPNINDAIQLFNKMKPSIKAYDVLIIDEYQDIEQEFSELLDLPYFTGCQAGNGVCCIKANGDILPCVLLDIPIGNIRENSFSTIWLNSPILEELNNRQKYSEPCVQCIYVEKCGGCRGVAYGSFGDYFAPDPHCWLDSNGERL